MVPRQEGQRAKGLAFRLLALVGAVAIPLLLLGAWTIWEGYRVEQEHAEDQLLEQARDMAGLVDREFDRTRIALTVLASAAPPASGDMTEFGAAMNQAATALSAGADDPEDEVRIRLLDRNGLPLLDTALFKGTLTRVSEQGLPEAAEAIATGKPQISNLRFGPVSHVAYLTVVVPLSQTVADGTGRAAQGAIAASVPRSRLLAIVADRGLPDGAISTILDRKFHTVARSAADRENLGLRPRPAILRREMAADSGVLPPNAITRDGYPARIAFAHAPVSGFIVQVSIPETAFSAPLRAKLLRAILLDGVALALALGLALAVAHRIVGAFSRVPQIVQSAIRANGGVVPRTGLREANALADALIRSETELLALNRELEHRVEVEVQAREAANIRAARAERLQALGQLAGGIAHDINNVLQAIEGAASLISRRPQHLASVTRNARLISEAVTRGASVTRRLLAFARKGALKLEAVDVPSLLHSVAELLQPALGPNIELRVSVPADPMPALVTDKGQLETVLVNLANNARDAMPNGGVLEMAASVQGVEATPDRTSDLEPGRYVRFDVADTGAGMDEATLARALEPFFTTKPMDRGTGLGLSMAKGFAEQSGGNLMIESQPGHGTAVRFWLRITPDRHA